MTFETGFLLFVGITVMSLAVVVCVTRIVSCIDRFADRSWAELRRRWEDWEDLQLQKIEPNDTEARLTATCEQAVIAYVQRNGGLPDPAEDGGLRGLVREIREMYKEIERPTVAAMASGDELPTENTESPDYLGEDYEEDFA